MDESDDVTDNEGKSVVVFLKKNTSHFGNPFKIVLTFVTRYFRMLRPNIM